MNVLTAGRWASRLHRTARVRAILLILLAVAGCDSDTNVAEDMAAGSDLTACTLHVMAPTGQTPCGPLTCGAGEICVAHQPGQFPGDLALPTDGGSGGGDVYMRSCVALPAACQQCGGCGDGTPGVGGKQVGCFATLCTQYETGCRFDGATLTCIGL